MPFRTCKPNILTLILAGTLLMHSGCNLPTKNEQIEITEKESVPSQQPTTAPSPTTKKSPSAEPFYNDIELPSFEVPDYSSPTLSFEENEIPELVSTQGSTTQVSSRHFYDGNHALQWVWNKNKSSLRFKMQVPYKARFRAPGSSMDSASVFGTWLYNERALHGKQLRISFGRGPSEDCYFNYGLGFTGWRFICIKFDSMEGNPHADMDHVIFQSPSGLQKGTLWLDQLRPTYYDDIRWQWPDYQMPFAANKHKAQVANELYINTPAAKALLSRPLPSQSLEQIAQLKKTTVESYAPGNFSEQTYQECIRQFKTWSICKTAEGLRGKQVHSGVFRDYQDLLLKIAQTHAVAEGVEKIALERMYILMTEHLLDQGWAEGSALDAQHHFGYKSRSWAPSVLLMEEALRAHGLLEAMVLSITWYGRDFVDYTLPLEAYPKATKEALAFRLADYLNTFANTHFNTLLLLEDSAFKELALANFSDLISQTILWDNGAIKPDGSFYHHGFHYAGYALPAFKAMAPLIKNLDGTPYEISPEAYNKLKNCVLATEKWGFPAYAFNACGRHPITGILGLQSTFERLSLAKPGTDEIDQKLAQKSLTIFGPSKNKLIQAADLQANPSQGFWNMNYAAFGCYRYADRTVQLKGYGPGVRSHETYKKDNRFGRYGSHGTMLIFQEGDDNTSGILEPGWDWSQPPGATTLQLPLDKLEGNSDAFYGWSPPQEAFFSGAGHLDNRYGSFAFALNGKSHEQSLQVRKSVFTFDGTLICLGSDIANMSSQYPTVTTLFQCGGEAPKARFAPRLAAAVPATKPRSISLTTRSQSIIDPEGNGFILPQGNDRFVIQQGVQHSMHNKTKAKTQGHFSKAWLDHGTGPENAHYEYVVLPGTDGESMAKTAQLLAPVNRLYEILGQNESCHAIEVPSQKVRYYNFFDSSGSLTKGIQKSGVILSSDTPIIVITKHSDANNMTLSATYPDPESKRPYDEAEPNHNITLKIQGLFDARASEYATASLEGTSTLLKISLKGSSSHSIKLQKR